jgi:hypothetical protein
LSPIRILGGGPAGSSAAIAARQAGCDVVLIEKSKFPRHKVCGEYFSPEIVPLLESLGVWNEFVLAAPARVRRLELRFGSFDRTCKLPEPAYGLSRYRFDEIVFARAVQLGAVHRVESPDQACSASIIAHGRRNPSSRGGRLFGFKSHFEGPANDAVELFFFSGCYVGVSPIEGGLTNVCGLGPENVLHSHGFDFDSLVNSCEKLSERLKPLLRVMQWHTVGPLVFQNQFGAHSATEYPCGDALSFVDPFTGSGLLSAVLTGRLAGMAAARGTSVEAYLKECGKRLKNPFLFSSMMRSLLANGWAEHLAGFVPGSWLVRLTRPHRVV